jgi:hypothetical protein
MHFEVVRQPLRAASTLAPLSDRHPIVVITSLAQAWELIRQNLSQVQKGPLYATARGPFAILRLSRKNQPFHLAVRSGARFPTRESTRSLTVWMASKSPIHAFALHR